MNKSAALAICTAALALGSLTQGAPAFADSPVPAPAGATGALPVGLLSGLMDPAAAGTGALHPGGVPQLPGMDGMKMPAGGLTGSLIP